MNTDELATKWREAKQREEAARNDRVAIEQEIIEMHPAKEEGAVTVHTAGGNNITLTGKLTYKVDIDVPKLWAEIAAAVETKPAKTGVAIKFKE